MGAPRDHEPLDGLTESELVRLAKAGSREAFGEIYRRHRDPVLRLARARLPDLATAEEVVQDTFLKAFLAIERVDPARPLAPWLATIAGRLVIDAHRTRRRAFPIDGADDRLAHAAGDRTLETILAAERLRALSDAVLELPARQRRILLSHVMDDLSVAELAAKEDVSEVSITSVVYRARGAIRRSLRRAAIVLTALGWVRQRVREVFERSARAPSLLIAECAEAALCWSVVVAVAAMGVSVTGAHPVRSSGPPAISTLRANGGIDNSPEKRFQLPASQGHVPPTRSGAAPAPVKMKVRTGPVRDDAVTPSSGHLRVEVVGPKGEVVAFYEANYDCADTAADLMPSAGPVRSAC